MSKHFKTPEEATEIHTIIKMAFIKEESEDMKFEETFRVKHEDTEEQTGWFSFSKLKFFFLRLSVLLHSPLLLFLNVFA